MRTQTRETYIAAVRDAAIRYASTHGKGLGVKELQRVAHAKLVYGHGFTGMIRGITCQGGWKNGSVDEFVEICASAEESLTQLAGTTIHECGHVAATCAAGHGKDWKSACEALGLRCIKAAGTVYHLANFAPQLRTWIVAIPKPTDGEPNFGRTLHGQPVAGPKPIPRPCSQGIGTRGGKSRGVGSGSRLRKFTCECVPPVIVRASRDELRATCNDCNCEFHRA